MSRKSFSEADLQIIAENLGQIYKDGIPVREGIDLIGETMNHKEYKKSLENISKSIKKGIGLSESFKEFDKLYPPFFTGLISVGENTGRLYKVLCGVGNFYGKYSFVVDSVKKACRYPLLIFVAMFILFLILTLGINPRFCDIYKSMNTKVPDICLSLLKLKLFCEENVLAVISAFICWGIVFVFITRYLYSKVKIDSFLKFKIVRNVVEYIAILIFSILCSTGINISYGLNYCEDSISPEFLNKKLKEINKSLINGNSLTVSLKNSGIFSKYTLSIIRMREESGTISDGFNEIAEKMEKDVSKEITKYLKRITPIFTIIMAIFIVVFLVVFIVPLYDSLQIGIVR